MRSGLLWFQQAMSVLAPSKRSQSPTLRPFRACFGGAVLAGIFVAVPWEVWLLLVPLWVAWECVRAWRSPAAETAMRFAAIAVTVVFAGMIPGEADRHMMHQLPTTSMTIVHYNHGVQRGWIEGPLLVVPEDLRGEMEGMPLVFPSSTMSFSALRDSVRSQIAAWGLQRQRAFNVSSGGTCGNGMSILFGAHESTSALYVSPSRAEALP